jgi:ribosome assembly protein SQT1
MLTEFEVADDDMPPDDDDESVWSEADNNDKIDRYDGGDIGAGGSGEPVEDMAQYTFTAHTDSVYCAALHPTKQGVVITGGGDDRAFIWSYEPGTEGNAATAGSKMLELSGHTDTVSAVGFNFDGTLALTGSYDGTVRIWSAETGELKLTLEGPEDVEFAEWHSKGNAILAGSKDGTAWMWLAQTGQCVQVFAGHDGGVSCGCFTRDGNVVCTGGEDGTVRLWAPVTGKCKHTFEGHFGHEGMVTCLVSSSDGDLLLSGE